MKKNRFKLEAKGKKSASSGVPFIFRLFSWSSLLLIFSAGIWFWSPEWGSSPLVSEPEKKLRELSRENPDAEVFEVKSEKAEK